MIYIVQDVPIYLEDEPNYHYVVNAESSEKAIEIVKANVEAPLQTLSWQAILADAYLEG